MTSERSTSKSQDFLMKESKGRIQSDVIRKILEKCIQLNSLVNIISSFIAKDELDVHKSEKVSTVTTRGILNKISTTINELDKNSVK